MVPLPNPESIICNHANSLSVKVVDLEKKEADANQGDQVTSFSADLSMLSC